MILYVFMYRHVLNVCFSTDIVVVYVQRIYSSGPSGPVKPLRAPQRLHIRQPLTPSSAAADTVHVRCLAALRKMARGGMPCSSI